MVMLSFSLPTFFSPKDTLKEACRKVFAPLPGGECDGGEKVEIGRGG